MRKLNLTIAGLIALIIMLLVLLFSGNGRQEHPNYVDPKPNETISSVSL